MVVGGWRNLRGQSKTEEQKGGLEMQYRRIGDFVVREVDEQQESGTKFDLLFLLFSNLFSSYFYRQILVFFSKKE